MKHAQVDDFKCPAEVADITLAEYPLRFPRLAACLSEGVRALQIFRDAARQLFTEGDSCTQRSACEGLVFSVLLTGEIHIARELYSVLRGRAPQWPETHLLDVLLQEGVCDLRDIESHLLEWVQSGKVVDGIWGMLAILALHEHGREKALDYASRSIQAGESVVRCRICPRSVSFCFGDWGGCQEPCPSEEIVTDSGATRDSKSRDITDNGQLPASGDTTETGDSPR